MNLRECLEGYKALTLELIDNTKNDRELISLIDKRGEILKRIEEINFDKEELKKIAISLNILELDSQLYDLVFEEKTKTKKKLDNLKNLRVARKNYNSTPNSPVIFSTRL